MLYHRKYGRPTREKNKSLETILSHVHAWNDVYVTELGKNAREISICCDGTKSL